MMSNLLHMLGRMLFRPLAWLGWATLFVVLFGICHLLGWRDDTSILSGTIPAGGGDAAVVRGLLYVATYFAAVLLSPILILAATLYAVLDWAITKNRPVP